MTKKHKKALPRVLKPFVPVLCMLFWVAVWAVAAALIGMPALLPSPLQTLRALAVHIKTAAYWQAVGFTLLRIALGYLAALIAGTLLAVLCFMVPAADRLFSPLRTLVRCVPVVSFIILLWLWLDKNIIPAFVSFLTVVPVMWGNVQEGLNNADPLLVEMARQYRFSRAKTLREIYLPAARTHYAAGCITAMGFAWKSGISAEVIARPLRALGTGIQDAKTYLETDSLFALTLTVVLISLLLEKGIAATIQRKQKKVEKHDTHQ